MGVRLLLFCLTASEAGDLVVLLFLHSAVDLSEPVVVCEDKGQSDEGKEEVGEMLEIEVSS